MGESAKRFPDVASALTVMVTDRATLKDCVETGVMCFLDTDMMDILGERVNDDLGKALASRGRGARCTSSTPSCRLDTAPSSWTRRRCYCEIRARSSSLNSTPVRSW